MPARLEHWLLKVFHSLGSTVEEAAAADWKDVRGLLATHWREANAAADDDGQLAIGLRITVQDGAPPS